MLLHQNESRFIVGDQGDRGLEGPAGFKGKPGKVRLRLVNIKLLQSDLYVFI